VILPYYNEEKFLALTLHSLCAQSLFPQQIVLIDNASTDDSTRIARLVMGQYAHIEAVYIREPRPGKVHALQSGLRATQTQYVATCDADTFYPPHYLALADRLFAQNPLASSVMAIDIYDHATSKKAKRKRAKTWMVSKILPRQCHTGGYGQMFKTAILRQCGGFSAKAWPFVLEDHEIIHRALKYGTSVYHQDLWCQPSTRRTNGASVNWNVFEQILYHLTPWGLKDWFFYDFLSRKLESRKLDNCKLRERNWV
jgi:glycosyltransferase involved in cell wall biosynthesis